MTTAVALTCLHDRRAQCWLCGDLVPWWREARLRAGLPAEPPNLHARIAAHWRDIRAS
jgi:hypothetical protein